MKRIAIAVAVGIAGLIMLPVAREFAEAVADTVSGGMAAAKYGSFVVLIGDNIYLALIVAWIAVIGMILFWPTGDRHDAQIR